MSRLFSYMLLLLGERVSVIILLTLLYRDFLYYEFFKKIHFCICFFNYVVPFRCRISNVTLNI